MSTEISKELVAVCMMGGVIIWVEKERITKLEQLFTRPRGEWPQFLDINGQQVNPARIEGIFTAQAMEEAQRRKNGEWQCKHANWHTRFEKCECVSASTQKEQCLKAIAFYKEHKYWPLNAPPTMTIVEVCGREALGL